MKKLTELTKDELLIIEKLIIEKLSKKNDEKLRAIAKKLINLLAD